jgi:hypothetical protein
MPQDSAALRVDEGDYAAQVGRFGETTLPVFLPFLLNPINPGN